MHQPYYKDDLSNSFLLPWVRLRAAKDYYKMPALLDSYPDLKQTFNLVPALVEQIQDYADGGVTDVYMDLARRPVSGLSADERAFIARWMTESSQIRRVRQYPRYLELVRKREQAGPPTAGGLATLFSDAELRDLLVWFNLSWIGPEAIEGNPEIAELVLKGRLFSEADVEPVLRVQFELLRTVLPKYRELQERGQAELITSPYYHPILPLIQDLGIARVARPDLKMPHAIFTHASDAPLSNAIGFEYQNAPPDEAAADLVDRLRAIQQRQQDTPFLAVIALDGENCWDSYEANGNPFLHSLYGRLLREPELKTVTVSEFIPAPGSPRTSTPGSATRNTMSPGTCSPRRGIFSASASKPRMITSNSHHRAVRR